MIVEPERLEDKENADPEDIEGQISRLWVDRFSPRHYTELLSDDVSFVLVFTFMLQIPQKYPSLTLPLLLCCSLPTGVCSNG